MFSETVRGPICNRVTILNDDIYEFEEFLTFNLSTTDTAVNLNPAGGIMIIQDEDGELFFSSGSLWCVYVCIKAIHYAGLCLQLQRL